MSVNYSSLPVITDTGECLEDGQIDWKTPKLKSLAVSSVMDNLKRSSNMASCGSCLLFAVGSSGEKRLYRANFCKDRMCPACQKRRSLVLFHQVRNICQSIQNENPTYKYLLLTLTVPNVKADRLPDELKHLMKSWDRLSKRKEFKTRIKGWFRALEITYNEKRDDYHPHFHVLLCVPSNYFKKDYISHARWLELWQESTKYPNITQVDIRAIKPNPKRPESDAISSAAAEVGKYATKPSDYVGRTSGGGFRADKKVVNQLASALVRKRLIAFGGLMKEHAEKLKLADIESNEIDLINVDGDSETIDAVMVQVFRWNVGFGNYIC